MKPYQLPPDLQTLGYPPHMGLMSNAAEWCWLLVAQECQAMPILFGQQLAESLAPPTTLVPANSVSCARLAPLSPSKRKSKLIYNLGPSFLSFDVYLMLLSESLVSCVQKENDGKVHQGAKER